MSSTDGNNDREGSSAALITLYLAAGMPLVAGKLDGVHVRRALQVFILGIVDFVSQAEALSEDEFYLLIDHALKACDLDDYPPEVLCRHVSRWIEQHPRLDKIMRMGAQSIRRYGAENDAKAPFDMAQVVVFSVKHPEEIGGNGDPAG